MTREPSLPRNVKILGLTSLLNDIASEMIFPLLPFFFLNVLKGSTAGLGFIEGLADSVASFLKLFSGSWSDRSGRRKGLVLFGYSVTCCLRPLLGVITAPWQVGFVRIGDRLGKGVRTAPRDAMLADSTDSAMRGRAFGFHRAMDHLGAAIGPLLAFGFLQWWPDELPLLFLLTAIPGFAVMLLLIVMLKDAPVEGPTRRHDRLRLTLRPFDRNFRLCLLALAVFTLGNSSDAFLLVRAEELGVETALLPILWCLFHILKSFGNWTAGRAVDRFGPRPLLFLGWLIYAGVYLAFGIATSAWEVWLCFGLYALFYSLTEPAEKTLITRLAGPEQKGLAFGWFHFALGVTTLPASWIFGWLYKSYGPFVPFAWGAALALLASFLLAWVRDRRR